MADRPILHYLLNAFYNFHDDLPHRNIHWLFLFLLARLVLVGMTCILLFAFGLHLLHLYLVVVWSVGNVANTIRGEQVSTVEVLILYLRAIINALLLCWGWRKILKVTDTVLKYWELELEERRW